MNDEQANTNTTQVDTQTQTNTQEHENIVVVSSEAEKAKAKGIESIDYQALTDKQLLEFEKKELLSLATKENVLKDLKGWQIQRLSRKQIVKRLREKSKPQEKKEVKKENSSNEQDTEDIILLQSAIIDVLTDGNPENLDKYCAKTLQDNNAELIDQEQAEKIKKFFVKFSIVHLIIRNNLGGYKALFARGKHYFTMLKQKYTKSKPNAA